MVGGDVLDAPKNKKDHEISLVVSVSEPSELNKVTLKRVRWKEPAAGYGVISTASCQNVFVYICSNIVGQALDLLVLSS